ncbi:c-type cytochrome [Frateuria defendens]|uniref:c-type cytochrome n=1 Tax=Frateuria defendens TaxID=2219559 RepID=UPI0007DC0209|nr:cytochrome c [Frateuria defendens]
MSKSSKRYWLWPLLAIVLAGLIVAAWLFVRQGGLPTLIASRVGSGSPVNLKDPALIARGRYLALAGDCVACHTVPRGDLYAGGLEFVTPFGTLYSTNITPDKNNGIGSWTADDFWRVMHYGVSPRGFLYPAFPFTNFTNLSREDSDAIFAYLMSRPASSQPNSQNRMPFPFNMRFAVLGWRMLYFRPAEFRPDPSQGAEWNRGKYLVDGLGHCNMCHSGRGPLASLPASRYLSGGEVVGQGWYGPALNQEGLAQWSVEDIAALLRTGVSPKGAAYGPMADAVFHSLQYLTATDAKAIATYVKTVPTKEPPELVSIAVNAAETEQLMAEGEALYRKECADCHQPNGEGSGLAYPPLAGNGSVTAGNSMNVIRIIQAGAVAPSTDGNPRPYSMPPFGQRLTDREIAALATYIRRSWGNRASAVSPAQVAKYHGVPL